MAKNLSAPLVAQETHASVDEAINPILNSPYEEPRHHYFTNHDDGSLDYLRIEKGRRSFIPDLGVIPVKAGSQVSLISVNDVAGVYGNHLVNLLRREVGEWRKKEYPGVTRTTAELLQFWFLNPERKGTRQLFFAQREAVETAVWLNEIAPGSNIGTRLLEELSAKNKAAVDGETTLSRIAFKMATGTGKTVVMAMLILYHFLNRKHSRNDTRFADTFLIVTPSITIKDRLHVLRVDPTRGRHNNPDDYYHQRGLVPPLYENVLAELNNRLTITNYHAFEPRTLKGNKASPFDGKKGVDGKSRQSAIESPAAAVRRLLKRVRNKGRLIVFNDEAHHCYLPRAVKGSVIVDDGIIEENKHAAAWYRGLVEVARQFTLSHVYDLSATPYYLSGSGHTPYSLFGWVVSDFGLVEAIESGLVKIPFIPLKDDTHELSMPVLRDLYGHLKHELPKMGVEGEKRAAKKLKVEGLLSVKVTTALPALLKQALQQFYEHYEKQWNGIGESQLRLDRTPPVFVVVCANTAMSREVYRYLAGYEKTNLDGTTSIIHGAFEKFDNYNRQTGKLHKRPPTLLIDSAALEVAEEEFKKRGFDKTFAQEIEAFKRDYARQYGSGESVTPQQIMREVVNTVGKPGKLGGHIRCVVSVSMLTEGWDANTVTHIVGLRAFTSQLLCEQVAGRALRRRDYTLIRHTLERRPSTSAHASLELFAPEYAHIIGVPFRTFRGGRKTSDPQPTDFTIVRAIPDRAPQLELTFPNVVGYREQRLDGEFTVDYSDVPHFEFDDTKMPKRTTLGTAVSGEEHEISIEEWIDSIRDQQVVFALTHMLLEYAYPDDRGEPVPTLFPRLLPVVQRWYDTRIKVLNSDNPRHRRLVLFKSPREIAEHIKRGIRTEGAAAAALVPILNRYNPFGSTRYVNGQTTRPIYPTLKSHVNVVVSDTESWEQIAAKTFEELAEVESYVKNEFLGFVIPYVDNAGVPRSYYPDFIVCARTPVGDHVNLIVEITGMERDKTAKKRYVQERWLPAVNAVRQEYRYNRWAFVEIANDIRSIKPQLLAAIAAA